MDLKEKLDECTELENVITIAIKNNSCRKSELNSLQSRVFECSDADIKRLEKRNRELLRELNGLATKKTELDIKIQQVTSTNDRLNEIVQAAQKSKEAQESARGGFNEDYHTVAGAISECELLKEEYSKLYNDTQIIDESLSSDQQEIKKLIRDGQSLVTELHKNDNILRVLSQQNRYAERHFDLIFRQLPWEPLTESYLEELSRSDETSIRNLGEVLRIQNDEIRELNESLNSKKAKKLEVLEELATQINSFVRRREEAMLMDGLNLRG